MDLLVLRVIVFAVLAFAYMMFDVLNNRNVPSYFAYASLVVGAAFTVLYLNVALIFYSALIAVATVGFGYVVYRIGQLGAAVQGSLCKGGHGYRLEKGICIDRSALQQNGRMAVPAPYG